MRFLMLAAFALSFFFSSPHALAAKNNVLLAYTMKAIARDMALAVDPTKKAVGQVTDDALLTAVIRTRTMNGLLQMALDRRLGELIPGAIEETSDPTEKQELADRYATLLGLSQTRLAELEGLYKTELGKEQSARDLAAAKAVVKKLESVIGEAHSLFKPPKP